MKGTKKLKETKKLYGSISNMDQRFIEEAQTEEIKKIPPIWKNRAPLAADLCAACLCVVAVCAVAAVRPWKAGITPAPDSGLTIGGEPGYGENPSYPFDPSYPSGNSVVPEGSLDESDESDGSYPFPIVFNDIDGPPAGAAAMINLAAEDFQPMSAEESLQYFGFSLPEEGMIPGEGFERTGGGCFGGEYGVYRAEEGGVYYDINSYVFTEGSKSFTLTLRTVFKNLIPSPEQVKNGPEKINFTKVNGWNLALFRYEGEDGTECVYTEFVQGGVVFSFTACGLEDDELVLALEGILLQKEDISEPSAVSGTVTHVDSRTEDFFDGAQHHYRESHDYITLDCGSAQLTVWLPGEADRFEAGDNVTVTYNGEPATACNIWPGQLVKVE